jgi:aspartate kinase
MSLIVQKYGGSSVATVERLRNVARKVLETRKKGHDVVVVVSAMGDSTDDLVAMARNLSTDPSRRELDVLLSTGEIVSTALLSIALQQLGQDAVSLTGAQCGIITNDVYSNARILEIRPQRIKKDLARGAIVVAAGFQGVNSRGETTTLGRGGSDTTAVALAAALEAEACEIYTDVAGVFTTDPRVVPQARYLDELSAREMLELAWTGAKVLKAEAVEFASSNNVPLVVRSTFEDGHDTKMVLQSDDENAFRPRRPEVAGVSGRADVLRIHFLDNGFTGHGHEAIFDLISKYDLIFGAAGFPEEAVDIFISSLDIPDPDAFVREFHEKYAGVARVTDGLGAVSLVGFGLGSRPAALLDACRVLEKEEIPVIKSFSARESFSFVMPASFVERCVRAMHRAFIETSAVDRRRVLAINSPARGVSA